MAAACADGAPVEEVLLARASALRMEGKRKSLPQVAAALRCWHAFAAEVLGYPESATLPPREGSHVEMFVAIFRNPATAQNYVGFLKWSCLHLRLPTEWYTATVVDTLRGARKRHLRLVGGAKHAAEILTDDCMQRLVALADKLKFKEFALLALVSWEFILRCQSEAIPLLAGCAGDATCLPASRHSGVWVAGDHHLCLRLRRRKNRPQGSLLKRPCTCATTSRQFCVVCRILARLKLRETASPLWELTSDQALKQLRRLLALLAVPNAQKYTLKAFRAGKATALAASGKSLGVILAVGEWRSSAFLSYVDTDAVDHAQLLDQTLAASDAEQD